MHPNPLHSAKRRVNPVTICIGFISKPNKDDKGAITMASDSRISIGTNVTDDAIKIVEVKFKNGSILMAKAGYRHSFNKFQELMEDRAANTEIITSRSVTDVANDAIRELQRELLDRNQTDAAQRIQDNYCEFILGFFAGGTPHLYTLNLVTRLAEKVDRHFVAIGDGETLANFLLTAINPTRVGGWRILHAATAVVEMCKVHNSSCGGPCRYGVIVHDRSPIVGTSFKVIQKGTPEASHKKLLRQFASNFQGYVFHPYKK